MQNISKLGTAEMIETEAPGLIPDKTGTFSIYAAASRPEVGPTSHIWTAVPEIKKPICATDHL
jgi:hypothetical protein